VGLAIKLWIVLGLAAMLMVLEMVLST